MTVNELLLSGVELMLLGMGIVFGFLVLLVGVLRTMSALALRMSSPEPVSGPSSSAAPAAAPGDPNLLAVISAAVARYRADHRAA